MPNSETPQTPSATPAVAAPAPVATPAVVQTQTVPSTPAPVATPAATEASATKQVKTSPEAEVAKELMNFSRRLLQLNTDVLSPLGPQNTSAKINRSITNIDILLKTLDTEYPNTREVSNLRNSLDKIVELWAALNQPKAAPAIAPAPEATPAPAATAQPVQTPAPATPPATPVAPAVAATPAPEATPAPTEPQTVVTGASKTYTRIKAVAAAVIIYIVSFCLISVVSEQKNIVTERERQTAEIERPAEPKLSPAPVGVFIPDDTRSTTNAIVGKTWPSGVSPKEIVEIEIPVITPGQTNVIIYKVPPNGDTLFKYPRNLPCHVETHPDPRDENNTYSRRLLIDHFDGEKADGINFRYIRSYRALNTSNLPQIIYFCFY